MSSRAAKRQKRIASPSESGSFHASSDVDAAFQDQEEEEDDEEEDIRPSSRRVATTVKDQKKKSTSKPATPTKKKPTAAATGRRQLASRQKRPERGGLRQSEISFSKAVPVTNKSPGKSTLSGTQESKENNGELEDDLIQDDDEEEETKGSRRPSFIAPTSRQASFMSTASQTSDNSQGLLRRGSGKQTPFAASSLGQSASGHTKTVAAAAAAHDPQADLPWAQRYAPRSLDELGVHKRKVADVRGWLDNVLKGYEKKRLLVLRGPSGAGKTATVQALGKELGFNILEWKNPQANSSAAGEYSSNTASLEDFLSRGQRYGSLDFDDDDAAQDVSQEQGSKPTDPPRRIILMEELPHVFSSTSTSSRNFRDSILRYLQAEESFFSGRDQQRARPPIVLIISESSSSGATAPSDSMTAHRVLGPDILQHPRVTPIEFNPVATTILAKALEQVLKRATQDGAAATQVSPAILHKLAERGDLRAGIAALEFMCLARSSSAATERRPVPLGPKRNSRAAKGGGSSTKAASGKNAVLTASEAALVDAVAQRSTMLDLFHAVGKVMYNKRRHLSAEDPSSTLVSEVDIDALLDDSGTEPGTFAAALHENYVLSCAGDSFVDALNACTETLSLSDLLMATPFSSSSSFSYSNFDTGANAAAIRQSDLAAHVAVQGLLEGLPYPVKRASIPGSSGRDGFKMFWPESLRVRGRADEVMSRAQHFVGTAASTTAAASLLVPCGRAPHEILLDDVPYRALIADAQMQKRNGRADQAYVKDLVGMARLENSRWGAEQVDGAMTSPMKKRHDLWKKMAQVKGKEKEKDEEDDMSSFIKGVDEKWVLSDDDIED